MELLTLRARLGGGKVPILDCLETCAWSQLSFVLFFFACSLV